MWTQQELQANGGHTPECERSCHESCPIGRERRAEANARAAAAQALWTANGAAAAAADAQQCQATTTDWSRCERPAARRVDGAAWDGQAQALCEQHAKRAERALARQAAAAAR